MSQVELISQVVTVSSPRPLEASAEFRIGLQSLPQLAEHAIHGAVVVPGALYIEMALRLDRELYGRSAGIVRHAAFRHPITLSADNTVVKVDVRDDAHGRAEYRFSEVGLEDGPKPRAGAEQLAATVEIDGVSLRAPTTSIRIDEFQSGAQQTFDSRRFYDVLRENGNQYGMSFQNVQDIWRSDDCAVATFSTRKVDEETGLTLVLDAAVQLLASFVVDTGRTFVLQSIERLEIHDFDFSGRLWAHGQPTAHARTVDLNFSGDVQILNDSGQVQVSMSGVALTLLEAPRAVDRAEPLHLAFAANFTADPIADVVAFWSEYFDVPIDVELAPYNQLFQQLLDEDSVLRRNTHGVNAILLRLEDWARDVRPALPAPDAAHAAQSFGSHERYVLPNGLEIVHLNRYETDDVYREIFDDCCYLKDGIQLKDGDTVIDIGANIGLFSLFVMSRCRNAAVYAFEPAPAVYELLKANCDAYGLNVRAVNAGVSDAAGVQPLTFYDKSSVFSTFHADAAEDGQAIRAVIGSALRNAPLPDVDLAAAYVEDLADGRLHHTVHECRMTTVSDIIRDYGLDTIHLLKIDAEKSELDIIRGIDDLDWSRIEQIVIEIHDRAGAEALLIERFLNGKGFQCRINREKRLEDTGFLNLYATRAQAHDVVPGHIRNLRTTTDDFCAALRSFAARTSAPLVLSVCPRPAQAGSSEDAVLGSVLEESESAISAAADSLVNVQFIPASLPLQQYPSDRADDPIAHHLGDIPYSQGCFAAIGTAIVRRISALRRPPFKVIALDCDNTLWKGVCGEDGAAGVEVTKPYRALQEFMANQMAAGMLLCLCSKNEDKDVLGVLDSRADMVLRREDFVSRRINWKRKSENLRSIAEELGVGLDSFIVVDDDPVECAEIRAGLPEALTIELPRNPESFAVFLKHVWAFDRLQLTAEDLARTRMYRDEQRRRHFEQQSISLSRFIDGLRLRVDITEARDHEIARVSQLTYKTNQFNLTGIRRSEGDLWTFRQRPGARCLAVRVADRFGDYGLVGAVLLEPDGNRYKVDTFLLSCRALGRGVEHQIASWLGQLALSQSRTDVAFAWRSTGRNRPAHDFMSTIGGAHYDDLSASWIVAADLLASVRFEPDGRGPAASRHTALPVDKPQRSSEWAIAGSHDLWLRIATELCDAADLSRAIQSHRLGNRGLPVTTTIGSPLESKLLQVWQRVLGNPSIDINDNFFEAGGTSLRAVELIALIKTELKLSLSIVALFECPTVATLAAQMTRTPTVSAAPSATLRGDTRRLRAVRRFA